ncbi:MAG: SPOR domain-containing protein [Bacteroidetes bacterium]|nr:SPOR domain-containing protein [Bacteroidota bacterium]
MKIDPFISELLYDHDCVIVTDLGGFIANYKPASINPALHMISPPSKKLAFNASLRDNDGLLASHISKKTAINYQDACEVIREYVKNANKNLQDGQKIKLEKIGVLFLDSDKKVQFLPDQHTNYLISSFGMTALHAPVIKREEVAPVLEPVPLDNVRKLKPVTTVATTTPKRKWRLLEVVPAAAVLTILFMVPPVLNEINTNLSTMLPFSRVNEFIREWRGEEVKFDPAKINYEYKSPFDIPPASGIKQAPQTNDSSVSITEDATQIIPEASVEPTPAKAADIVVENTTAVAETTAVAVNTPAPAITAEASSGRMFHIIAGCFRSKENAEKFIAELQAKQVEATIIGQNNAGLYMVSIFASQSFGQTTDALTEMKNNVVESAWVYKKQ